MSQHAIQNIIGAMWLASEWANRTTDKIRRDCLCTNPYSDGKQWKVHRVIQPKSGIYRELEGRTVYLQQSNLFIGQVTVSSDKTKQV